MSSVKIYFMKNKKIDKIINKYDSKRSALISILFEIQTEFGYLGHDTLRRVAERLEMSLTQIFGVVNFYKIFRLEPKGRHNIQVCLGTACHVRGGAKILDELERRLNIKVGETTKDLMFTLERVNCLGCCAIGPVAVVDGNYYGNLTPAKITSLLKLIGR